MQSRDAVSTPAREITMTKREEIKYLADYLFREWGEAKRGFWFCRGHFDVDTLYCLKTQKAALQFLHWYQEHLHEIDAKVRELGGTVLDWD